MNLKQRANGLKTKITAVFLACKRKDTPFYAKLVAGITVGYALSPIDLIPDFIPVLGYLDDIIILPILIALSVKLIPPDIMRDCEIQAKNLWADGKPRKWQYAIPIVLIWMIIITVVTYKIFE